MKKLAKNMNQPIHLIIAVRLVGKIGLADELENKYN